MIAHTLSTGLYATAAAFIGECFAFWLVQGTTGDANSIRWRARYMIRRLAPLALVTFALAIVLGRFAT